jgi:hypothetical protein
LQKRKHQKRRSIPKEQRRYRIHHQVEGSDRKNGHRRDNRYNRKSSGIKKKEKCSDCQAAKVKYSPRRKTRSLACI